MSCFLSTSFASDWPPGVFGAHLPMRALNLCNDIAQPTLTAVLARLEAPCDPAATVRRARAEPLGVRLTISHICWTCCDCADTTASSVFPCSPLAHRPIIKFSFGSEVAGRTLSWDVGFTRLRAQKQTDRHRPRADAPVIPLNVRVDLVADYVPTEGPRGVSVRGSGRMSAAAAVGISTRGRMAAAIALA